MPRRFDKCPRCHQPTQPSNSWNGMQSEFWVECTNPECNTYINTYIPLPHQRAVHEDPHTYVGNFGAYGTGKTLTSREEFYKHLFLTPNCNALIGANVSAQYEQTIKRDIESDLPKDFIKHYNAQKSYYDFVNGGRLMFRSFDDPNKLRSLNLTYFNIIEGSEVKGETFHQLKTRLRNLNATKADPDKTTILETGEEIPIIVEDWRKGIIESNPDPGWIRSDILYNSSDVTLHGNVEDDFEVPPDARDDAISSHVASTDVNLYLPPNFIPELIKNKPVWWIHRFIYGSFSYAEGLVYPAATSTFCQPFEIPVHWKRIIAADYGLSDNFVYLYGAVDEKKGIVYIYKEVVTNNRNIEELSKMYHKNAEDIPAGGLYSSPLLDPKSGAKRDYNKKTLFDHFLDYGISFKPGHINLDARIFRLNTYMESGRVKIFYTCNNLKTELEEYKFPPKTLTNEKKRNDKPMDKNNHCINPLEWITMELPANPSELMYGAFNKYGDDLTQITPHDNIMPHALDDTLNYGGGPYEMEVFEALWE